MITEEHVRDLLRPRDDEPVLVVVRGRARVIPASELDTGEFRGALEVASAKDLERRIGTGSPSDQDITTLAGVLNTTVAELGG